MRHEVLCKTWPALSDAQQSLSIIAMRLKNKKSPPLIAHIIFRLGVGGLENGLVNLINHMPVEKYQHAIICLKDSTDFRKRLKRQDVAIYSLNKKEGHDIGTFFRLYKLLRTIQPDIVHTRNLAAIECQLPAWIAGVKYRVHGEHGWDVFDPDGNNVKYQLLRRLLKPLIHQFIPLSLHLQRYLVEKIHVADNKITRICNGVDTTKFYPLNGAKNRLVDCPFAFQSNELVIGTVGRMHGVKDQITLVNAYVLLMRNNPEFNGLVKLIIIGEGPLRNEAMRLLRQESLDHDAWLPGERKDIAEIMRNLDLFVLPSQAEGISNTILEGMATGLPVVATKVGGNPELVQHNITGSLVTKADPEALAVILQEYILNKDKRQWQGDNGLQRILSEFSLNAMVKQYTDVYDGLVYREQ